MWNFSTKEAQEEKEEEELVIQPQIEWLITLFCLGSLRGFLLSKPILTEAGVASL